jgi:DNA-binding PucR family transcriptional regulator
LRSSQGHDEPVIAIGPVIDDPADLARGRIAVDRILRVLHSRQSNSAQVAELDDVRLEALLMEMRDILDARGDSIDGPIARLRDYDDEHGTSLQETLEAWLDSFGDIRVAAKSVHVHPNTFRYRLKRIGEVAEIDLTCSDNRFAVMLQLRLSRLR